MNTVQYDDMIGMPFKTHAFGPDQFDCIGVVREVYRRAGWSSSALPTADNEAACAAACAVADSDVVGHEWEPIASVAGGRVTGRLMFGDVVMVCREYATHVSVVVDESRQVSLSAAEQIGVYACGVCRLTSVSAIYRLKESAR